MKEVHSYRSRFPIFFLVSLVIHLSWLGYGAYVYREELKKIAQLLTVRTPKILVDLTDPRQDPHDSDKQVISRYDYAGKGKLAPLSGQHLSGDFNPITSPKSTALEKPQGARPGDTRREEESKAASDPTQRDGTRVAKESKNKPDQMKQESQAQKPQVSQTQDSAVKNSKRLSVDTEDSLENKFWFDESQYLQISVGSHPDAEFSLELTEKLKKRFANYVLGGGALNFYHVKKDSATALATINSHGEVKFERMIDSSETQSYMNYLVSRVVDHPGVITQLPQDLRGKNTNLYFLFNIRFTGEPLRKWWMGFEFLPGNNPE